MKTYSRENIWQFILRDKEFAKRCMLKLYDGMTSEEKSKGYSIEHNNIGYNRYDAQFMCSICEKIIAHKSLNNREFYTARYRLKKYLKQLTNIANELQEVKAEYIYQNGLTSDTQSNFYGLDNNLYCEFGICADCNYMRCLDG
jgi:hypothetical protein|nr:MAG TPA: hypothetical protein [Caudoviricetes sp.]